MLKPAYPGEDAMGAMPTDDPSAMPEKDGYEICIACHGDGTFTVSVENGEQESAEDQSGDPAMGGEAAEPAGVECKSVKAALTLALEITRNQGRMPGQADDDFQSGFGASNA